MKFYVDFDHTLFNTNIMINDMIQTLADHIIDNGDFEIYSNNFRVLFPNIDLIELNKDKDEISNFIRQNFKRPEQTVLKIRYNIFSLAETLSKLFSCDYKEIENKMNNILDNGDKNLYDDSKKFLELLKKQGHQVFILSHEKNDLNFQQQKIVGSGIIQPEYVDGVIITRNVKAELTEESVQDPNITRIVYPNGNGSRISSIDYQNGIFIDDRPKDLEAYYQRVYQDKTEEKKKVRVFRISRESQTYTNQEYSSPEFETGIIEVHDLNSILKKLNIKENEIDEDSIEY